MFEQVLASPLVPQVAALIEKRLGGPLEPFDVWYNGFRARGAYTEAQLDEIVSKRYPTPRPLKKISRTSSSSSASRRSAPTCSPPTSS